MPEDATCPPPHDSEQGVVCGLVRFLSGEMFQSVCCAGSARIFVRLSLSPTAH